MERTKTVALLHPGAMGASLGASLVRAGRHVRWLAAGRSEATQQRADAAGLVACASWEELLDGVDVVCSICPPAAATAVAGEVAAAVAGGPSGGPSPRWLYVDANAISPARALHVRGIIEAAGATFVDGDVIGPPAGTGRTVVYLSGPAAPDVAALFDGGEPSVVCLGDDPFAASALKMLYAGWTKGTHALLLTLWAGAQRAGVADALAAEWQASQPDVAGRLADAAQRSAPKAWRFAGEMDEIADTLAGLDLPAGFWQAAAALYRRLDGFKDQTGVTIDDVVAELVQEV